MNSLIVGAKGEVGKAYAEILSPHFKVFGVDIKDEEEKEIPKIDTMHVAIPGLLPDFVNITKEYVKKYKPSIIDILSTVLPGTCEKVGPSCCHSTTRGMHPNLSSGIRNHIKFIGGKYADYLSQYYAKAGIKCVTFRQAKTSEAAHVLTLIQYGVDLMLADEKARLCREWGVDYLESIIKYEETGNKAWSKMDMKRLSRPILLPPNGKIGGHCVRQSAQLIPDDMRPLMVGLLAKHGSENGN